MKSPAAALCLALAACGTTYEVPRRPAARPAAAAAARRAGGAAHAPATSRRVAARVEPAAEAFCREEAPGAPAAYCDFRIRLETDPRMPPNAFQTRGRGRPPDGHRQRSACSREMRSDDEIAFVLSPREPATTSPATSPSSSSSRCSAPSSSAASSPPPATPTAAPPPTRRSSQAMDVGAYVGARTYSQTYELEADTLGAYIAARAGYDPERGADDLRPPGARQPRRPADPRHATRPPAQRQATVARVAADIRRQQAARPRRPAPRHAPARKVRAAAILGVASHSATSLDTPSPQRTGPAGSQRGGENRAARCGTRQSKDASRFLLSALFDMYDLMKGYAGGLVHFDGRTVCISAP